MKDTLIISQMFSNNQQKSPSIFMFLPFFVMICQYFEFKDRNVQMGVLISTSIYLKEIMYLKHSNLNLHRMVWLEDMLEAIMEEYHLDTCYLQVRYAGGYYGGIPPWYILPPGKVCWRLLRRYTTWIHATSR